MYIDFLVAIILIACIIIGDKRGFVRSFIGAFGWIFSFGAAWFFRMRFIGMLDVKTGIRDDISTKIIEIIKLQLMKKAANIPEGDELPGSIASALTHAADRAVTTQAENAAAPIVDALIGVLAFVILFTLFKMGLFFIQSLLWKFTSKGPFSAIDSLGGIAFGLIKGLLLSYIIVLVVGFSAIVTTNDLITNQVTSSVLIGFLQTSGLIPFSGALNTILSM